MGKQAGEKIRDLRQRQDIVQSALASKVGVSDSAIRSYELGTRTPKAGHREAIAEALGCSPDYLIDYEVEQSNQVMHYFMQLEENLSIEPVCQHGETYLKVTDDKVAAAIKDWAAKLQAVDAGEVGKEDYQQWKATFDIADSNRS